MLDIKTLREKSRNLDLPLISALCNDRNLLRQTKAFVLPKHPTESTSSGTSKSSPRNTASSNGGGSSSRQKYPVSGLSTTQISKPPRKAANSTHKHPSSSMAGLSKTAGNAYQVNDSSVTANDKKNPSRASHSWIIWCNSYLKGIWNEIGLFATWLLAVTIVTLSDSLALYSKKLLW